MTGPSWTWTPVRRRVLAALVTTERGRQQAPALLRQFDNDEET